MPEHDSITSSQDYRYQKFEIEITDFIGVESTHGPKAWPRNALCVYHSKYFSGTKNSVVSLLPCLNNSGRF